MTAELLPLALLVATTVLTCVVGMLPEGRPKRRLVNGLSALCCAGFLAAALLLSPSGGVPYARDPIEGGMMMRLWDLAAEKDDRRFSPFCWRARMALRHKGLEFESVPWRMVEKDAIAFSGQEKVPVLEDGERVVADSWAIATYLEEAYPDRASLFGGPAGRALSRFTVDWTDMSVHGGLIRMLALDIHDRLHPKDREYYRRTREARFGMTLEAFCEGRESRLPEFRKSLAPLRATLKQQPFLGGEARSSRTTWSSAPCNGRAASTPSRCWKPKIP